MVLMKASGSLLLQLLALCCVCWAPWASAEAPRPRQLRPASDVTALCTGFRTICDFVATNCDTVDASTASGDCLTSFELYYTDRAQLHQCEALATDDRDKQQMRAFLEKYEQWQRARVCAKFHATEKRAAHDCSGENVHRPWNAETWPLFCHETFTTYKGMRKDLESLCPRTQYSETFWEGYVDYIASPTCKKYYDHVRAAATRNCDSQSEWGQQPCAGIFDWYLKHRKTVETECFELHRSKPFYKGFYGWKALRAPRVTVFGLFYCVGPHAGWLCVEFVYYDFNGTTGLVLNGNAATSSCVLVTQNSYSNRDAIDDQREASLSVIQTQLLELVELQTTETENHTTSSRFAKDSAQIGHRDAFVALPTQQCAVRLRLTASQPNEVASVWYVEPLPVIQGFEMRFTFQITDQSQRCFEVKDQHFGVRKYRTCMVHGGDGLAFVLHSHANKTGTLGFPSGSQRSQMGYEGIENSLAIEFDTWFNPEFPDTFGDHVSIYSRGQGANSVLDSARLSASALHDLADGRIHAVKIRYFNELKYEYAPFFSATTNLVQFIKDVSEGRRMGTLVVFMDDGIDSDTPLLAIPINLAATLRLNSDEAYAGFTASTGLSWQKHDVLGWYYCTQPPCLDASGTEMRFDLDFNQQSMRSAASHAQELYPIYIYPDTTPWAKRQTYYASGQQIGLVS